MSSPLERRYRRLLRLLPHGYRQMWEDDMVAAILDTTEHADRNRPTPAERLSVVRLALRLRLNGAHATPRWALWYHVAYGVALLVLLYQAVSATATAGYRVAYLVHVQPLNIGPWYEPFLLSWFVGLLWVPAFACLVLRRVTAARILATVAALASLAVTLAIVQVHGLAHLPFGLGDASRWGWLAVSAAVVFVTPTDAKSSPWLWFVAWLVGSTAVFTFKVRSLGVRLPESWTWLRIGDLTSVSNIALIAAIAVALTRVWPMRATGSPHWLLALGIVAGGIGGIRLARWSEQVVPPFEAPAPVSQSTILATVLIALAFIALAVGLLGWQHSTAVAREP